MRRLTSFVIALAAAMTVSAGAKAASLYFELVATTTTACPAPCFQVRMFLEDPSRSLVMQAIQMDIAVLNGTAADLPTPPATNANASGKSAINAIYTASDEETTNEVAWATSATVGASPALGFDALTVLAAVNPFTINDLEAIRADSISCFGGVSCPIWNAALPLNRVYLGRFNVTAVDLQAVGFGVQVGGITGNGEAILGPEGVSRLNGGSCTFGGGTSCSIEGLVPEPASVVLLGLALAGLGLARRRS